jgi:ankyrin repeat protein
MWCNYGRHEVKRFLFGIVLTLAGAAAVFAQSASVAGLIQSGNRNVAFEKIRAGADVNEAQPDGTTPLHWAVYRVDYELVETLLKRGAKPAVANEFGSTPLAEAVKIADARLVRMLLDAGAAVDTANEDGQTPLMLAVRNGEPAVVELLIRAGANVNVIEEWRGQTPLMWAAARSAPEIVKLLIAKGADVEARAAQNDWESQITSEPRAQYRPTGGHTALLYAARSGCHQCVDAFLDAGADINRPTPDGVTPLMLAIDNSNYEVAKRLMERGANPHLWDWWGRTALYIATDMRAIGGRGGPRGAAADLDTIKMLLAAGVNPNPQLNMHRPSRSGNSGRFSDDLLTTGVTPLIRAAQIGDVDVIRELLKHGALVDLPNVMGVTPFMAAAGVGFGGGTPGTIPSERRGEALEAMEILRQAGADVNARITDTSSYTARIARRSQMTDRQGQTALFVAAQAARADIVRYLLDHGARLDVKDDMGRTPMDAASGNTGGRQGGGSAEVREILKAALARP